MKFKKKDIATVNVKGDKFYNEDGIVVESSSENGIEEYKLELVDEYGYEYKWWYKSDELI